MVVNGGRGCDGDDGDGGDDVNPEPHSSCGDKWTLIPSTLLPKRDCGS